jgi:hypothetical protein
MEKNKKTLLICLSPDQRTNIIDPTYKSQFLNRQLRFAVDTVMDKLVSHHAYNLANIEGQVNRSNERYLCL